MKIGILVSNIGNFGIEKYYNSQEIGLGKALSKVLNSEVCIYKLVDSKVNHKEEDIILMPKLHIRKIPAKCLGSHGFMDIKKIEKEIKCLIYFSDTQLFYPKVCRWAKKNNIQVIPYVGRVNSTSKNVLKRCLADIIACINIKKYKKQKVFVKTPYMQRCLKDKGINNTIVAPVGLDLDVTKNNYDEKSKFEIKKKLGFNIEDKFILFVGRIEKEKNPEYFIKLIEYLRTKDNNYKLLMIGDGELFDKLKEEIRKIHAEKYIIQYRKVLNVDMWKYYYISEAFINICENEIFGMAILEAMYYECPVIALKAPGPCYIINNGKNGFLIEDKDEKLIYEKLKSKNLNVITKNAKIDLMNKFLWDNSPLIEEVRKYE